MKRHLTLQEKKSLMDEFVKNLDGLTNGKVEFTKEIKIDPVKIKIYYTPDAFAKTVRLIMSHSGEIAWHFMVRRKDKDFEVYDVLTYPQTVGPANVHVKMGRTFGDGKPKDPKKYYNDWYIDLIQSLPEGQEEDLCGQAHSHVNFGTTPSSTDLAQQKEEILNKRGFYLFQIWNKKLDINTMLYDIDNGILYEKDDVELIVEEDNFTKESHDMLVEPEKPVLPPVEKTDKWTDQWSGNGFIDYPGERKFRSERKLPNFSIMVEYDGNMTEFIVEAPTAKLANELFENWVFINNDAMIDYFGLNISYEVPVNWLIHPAVPAFNDEEPDITYDELKEMSLF